MTPDVDVEFTDTTTQTAAVTPGVAELIEVSRRANLQRGNRILIRARLPRKWTEISALAAARSCMSARWWRGCDDECSKLHRRQKTVCSVVLLEFEDTMKSSLDGSLIPLRFIGEAFVVPGHATVPSVETAFWSYVRVNETTPAVPSSGSGSASSTSLVPLKQSDHVVMMTSESVSSTNDKPTTCVPLFDKILATGRFELDSGLSRGIFVYLQIPDDVGILTYLRRRQGSFDWMLMWRGCCDDCRDGGKYPHATNLTCYLLFLGLRTAVSPEVFVSKTFIEWVKSGYEVARFGVRPDEQWQQNWTEGLYMEKKTGGKVNLYQVRPSGREEALNNK